MKLTGLVAFSTLALIATACSGRSDENIDGATQALATDVKFFTPKMNTADMGAIHQVAELRSQGRHAEAAQLSTMIETPQAVWLTQGDSKKVMQQARQIAAEATGKGTVPVFVAYNIPFRDCAQFSAGGATTKAEYLAWVDAVAAGIGSRKAVVILEPDGLGIIPHNKDIYGGTGGEWCQPADANAATAAADRYEMLNYAVDALKALGNVSVYLDGTHGAWLGAQEAADRLERAGVRRADGFFLNVSNYQTTPDSIQYGRLVSKVLALSGAGPAWAYDAQGHFHYDWLSGQYVEVSPGNWQADLSPAHVASLIAGYDSWGAPASTIPFVIDTSRNGQGPWTPSGAPSGGDAQVWCNPPSRGLGLAPTANTGEALVAAYLWVKIPGESDGECNRWAPVGSADPVRGYVNPAAGEWFPAAALELTANASPAL
jgi:endoglucanase